MGDRDVVGSTPGNRRDAAGDGPADPFVALGVSSLRRGRDSSPNAVGSRTGLVFPTREPSVVYSSTPLRRVRRRPASGRPARTAAALAALGAALWWALNRLGDGLSAL